jgi:hypothetical protein
MKNLPPAGLSPPQLALWWLRQGDFKLGAEWEAAHAICQTAEGSFAYDLVHALAHWIEGDISNRDYWYARVGVAERADTVAAEWERISRVLRETRAEKNTRQ